MARSGRTSTASRRFRSSRVAQQIENGGGPMPPKLLTGKDAANIAAYVASVAGK